MKPYAFGVDLGGTTVKIGLFKTDGALVCKWEIPTRTENHGEHILPDISAQLLALLDARGIDVSDVHGIGLAVPGAVTNNSLVAPCVNLDQWSGEAGVELSKLCGIPVVVCNDANAAAMGEMSQVCGGKVQNVCFITLGTGVGGGIIVDGKLLTGYHGAGGEIGHMKVRNDETDLCSCGKRGCLEQYASATGIVRLAKKRLAQGGESVLRQHNEITSKLVFDCAKDGDALSLAVVDEMTATLGRAIANISCLSDPEAVIIGGGVARAGEIIRSNVEKAFLEAAFPPTEGTQFLMAVLGNDAGIYGCLQLALTLPA